MSWTEKVRQERRWMVYPVMQGEMDMLCSLTTPATTCAAAAGMFIGVCVGICGCSLLGEIREGAWVFCVPAGIFAILSLIGWRSSVNTATKIRARIEAESSPPDGE